MNRTIGIRCDHERKLYVENQDGEIIAWVCRQCPVHVPVRTPAREAAPTHDDCDCGNRKLMTQEACQRCQAIDGGSTAEYAVRSALRNVDGWRPTWDEIAEATGFCTRHVMRVGEKLGIEARETDDE